MRVFQNFVIQLVIIPNGYHMVTFTFLAIIFLLLVKAGYDLVTDDSEDQGA
jgi:hypothetical protein